MYVTESLKKNQQFRLVYNRGKSIANRYLVMYVLPNGKEINRLGLSISKKVGKSVTRSRVTRLIKENYRLSELKYKTGFDIVIIARVICSTAGFEDINKSFHSLIRKHSLLRSI